MTYSQLEIVSPVFIVTASILFLIIERVYPYNPQKALREGFWVDLIGYGLIQSIVMGWILGRLIYGLDNLSGASRLHWVSGWPVGVQVLFFLVTHDLSTYLIHRAQHKYPILWRTHEAHHSVPSVDWLSGIRSHSMEIFLYETAKFVPIILLGASPEVPLYRSMIDSTYGMFIHSNLDIRLGPFIRFFNGPQLHRWHHAEGNPEAYNRNYSTKLAIWDFIFGTVYDPPHRKAERYGLEDPFYPKTYFGQLFYCFRKSPIDNHEDNNSTDREVVPVLA